MKLFLPFRVSRTGLFSDLSAWDSCPLRILDFVELRVPPLISHEKTVPSRQSLQKRLHPYAPSGACRGVLLCGGRSAVVICSSDDSFHLRFFHNGAWSVSLFLSTGFRRNGRRRHTTEEKISLHRSGGERERENVSRETVGSHITKALSRTGEDQIYI
jgi:hypothetical protein